MADQVSFSGKVLETELAKGVNVSQYLVALSEENRPEIIKIVRKRFEDRYLKAIFFDSCPGFTMLAVSCLMIEALESFREGLPSSDRESEKLFKRFFESYDDFEELRPVTKGFYKNVRCGILHQAETTGGWLIHKYGPLFDPSTLTVNAKEFVSRLKHSMEQYLTELANADWDSVVWVRLKNKFASIIENCERE